LVGTRDSTLKGNQLMTEPFTRRNATQWISMAILVALFACADQGGGTSGASGAPSDDDKIFYSIGMMAGMGIREFELTEAEFEWVARGVADAALGREPLANPEDYMIQIQEVYTARKETANAAEATASAAFLEQEAAVDGAVVSESGMIMQVDHPDWEASLFKRLFALSEPHTTGPSRSCESCHRNASALGLGRGELNKRDGAWLFQPSRKTLQDGLPADAWTSLDGELQGQSSGDDIRPLNEQEIRTILDAELAR